VIADDWNAVAAGWDRYYDWYADWLQPFTDWCCEAVRLTSRTTLLDIAGGAGLPALPAALRVQPHGSVVMTDISSHMIRLAERRGRAMSLTNIVFREMDAAALDFPDESFDAVTCAFGLMLCPDPEKVVAEIKRVLRPGGRFAISVWDTPSKNSFLAIFGRSALQALSLPPPDRSQPGPFRFAERGQFEAVLCAGGFTDFDVESRPLTVAYESIDSYLEMSLRLAPGLGQKLSALSPADARRFAAQIREAATPFLDGGRLRLTATPLCASGCRGGA
jgi:SAM-dependent methyltransferase